MSYFKIKSVVVFLKLKKLSQEGLILIPYQRIIFPLKALPANKWRFRL